LSPTQTILVVAPGAELRRSIVFALEANGFKVESHPWLGSAAAAAEVSPAACLVIDENALVDQPSGARVLKEFARPVVLLVDRLRAIPRLARIKVLRKPMLGDQLIETVRGALAAGQADIT
jgi:hypothetical protein